MLASKCKIGQFRMVHQAVDTDFHTEDRANSAVIEIQPPGASLPSRSVPRTVAAVILTTVLVLGGLYLLWQAREVVGWCVGGCVIAAALDPAVKRLQKYHIKRSKAILLVYAVLVLGGLGLMALFLQPLVEQIRGLTSLGRD